ncbi:unnamed protein product [Adineta steineri]|uniref:N-acetyltransferase domain-containing protein n=1 Tax=Adineta steineri TaxID=433720 RepID=A0A815D6E5_9BILA|nr:unnamed protein product [Adineta steineri]CAF3797264.1 unnamed protein product [Adineta steineri]
MDTTSLKITHTIPSEEAKQTMIDIESLAKKVYQSSMVLSSDLLYRWYQLNPFMWWVARDNHRLIGYISVIPLKHEAFLKSLQPEFNEYIDITDDDIRIWNDGFDKNYSLYICSMVVDPEYRQRTDLPIYRLLVKSFFESILFYGKNGSVVTEWSGVAVSQAGCHILQNYFDLTCLNSDNYYHKIYYGKTNIDHQQQQLQRLLTKLQLLHCEKQCDSYTRKSVN